VATVYVAIRVTDDGCPNLQAVDYDTYTVNPAATSGLPIIENFETWAGGQITATGWGVTGAVGNAYYLNSVNGGACFDTTHRWGTTVNAAQGNDPLSPGQSHFLNENGVACPNSDLTYVNMNRATIVYTPEFTVPATGATLTIRPWYDMTYIYYPGIPSLFFSMDGGRPILSNPSPGSITWSDFCNSVPNNYRPLHSLDISTGLGYNVVDGTTDANHPLNSQLAHTYAYGGTTPSWRTNTYVIDGGTYGGQLVRVGFLFGSDDLDTGVSGDCNPNDVDVPLLTLVPGDGWRIQWMQIVTN
jgi:hypothetical protein